MPVLLLLLVWLALSLAAGPIVGVALRSASREGYCRDDSGPDPHWSARSRPPGPG